MADPLREALAVFIARWEARGGDADEYTRLRALLAAHPEPEPDPRACPDCGRPDHPEHFCGVTTPEPVEPAEPPAPEGAVRVRIAVAVDANGEWEADGGSELYEEQSAAREVRRMMGGDPSRLRLSWVEAWVPRPAAEQVVEGRVESEFTTNDRS